MILIYFLSDSEDMKASYSVIFGENLKGSFSFIKNIHCSRSWNFMKICTYVKQSNDIFLRKFRWKTISVTCIIYIYARQCVVDIQNMDTFLTRTFNISHINEYITNKEVMKEAYLIPVTKGFLYNNILSDSEVRISSYSE